MDIEERRVGVAVIGLGVGEQHARAYLRTGTCTLRWVYDLNPDKMSRVLAELGQGAPAPSFDAMISDPAVHAFSIASYDHAHFDQVTAALRAGKHVFVEKPLCRSLAELREIKRLWHSRANTKLASNLVLRTAPLYQWLKRAIEEGDFGEIYAFDGDYLYGRLEKITGGWRKSIESYSVMQGGGIHLVDLMLWLTEKRPVSVRAVGNRICTVGTDFRYHDYLSATFQFSSGLIGRITANFGCVHRHQHVVRLFGTKATFIYDDQGPRVHQSRNPLASATELNVAPLPSSKSELIPGFVRAILKGQDIRKQTHLDFDVISACVAADQAAVSGDTCEISYV